MFSPESSSSSSSSASSEASSSSTMSSTRSSPVHHASLVDPSTHSPALLQLVEVKISRPIIDYIVDCVAETVDFAMGRTSPARGRQSTRRPGLSKFTTFVSNVLTRAEVNMPVVLASLVYIDRAKPHLHIALEEWALERVFLGSLILASKYLNDSTLKNIHWALCTGVFGKRDVGRIEREFLDVLDWELNVTEDELLSHHAGISAIAFPSSPRQNSHHQPTQTHEFSRPHHSRNHHRSSASVPELEPSSPISSDGSISPQTPSTHNSSPDAYPHVPRGKSSVQAATKAAMAVAPHKHSSFQEILRSFPIPHHHHHHHPTSHHTQSHFPIQV